MKKPFLLGLVLLSRLRRLLLTSRSTTSLGMAVTFSATQTHRRALPTPMSLVGLFMTTSLCRTE